MRVLIVTNACPPRFVGGAELVAHEQAKALAALGHDVRFFAGDLNGPASRHAQVDGSHEGIIYHRIATEPKDYSSEYLNFLHPRIEAHFREVLRAFRPDIVHCHNLIGLSAKLPIIASQHGCGTVCTLHDFWGFCARNTALRADGTPCEEFGRGRSCVPRIHDGRGLDVSPRFRSDFLRLAFDHVDRLVSPSRFVARRYAQAAFPTERLRVVPNGVDTERFRPATPRLWPTPIRITYAGYMGEHKGVSNLLDAFKRLSDTDARLHLAGDGPELDRYRERARVLGIAERTHFIGKVQPADMPAVYAASDIVVLPSIWDENQPVCLMEAMACGLPVIASRRGGIPEIVEDRRNGLLFAAGDVGDLAAQLERLIGDADLRRTAGDAGRKRVEALSHAHQADRLLAVYAEAIGGPSRVCSRAAVYTAIGPVNVELRDDVSPAAGEATPRRLVPDAWIADLGLMVDGVLFTGPRASAHARAGIGPIVRFPRFFRRVANILLRLAMWGAQRAHTDPARPRSA